MRASTTEFDFSEESIEDLARRFGISEVTIRRMGSHSGKVESSQEQQQQQQQQDEDEDEDEEEEEEEEEDVRDGIYNKEAKV